MSEELLLSLKQKAEEVRIEFENQLQAIHKKLSPKDVESLRVSFLGKKGKVSELLDALKTLSKEEKPTLGKIVNLLRAHVEGQLEDLKHFSEEHEISEKLKGDSLDISLPVDQMSKTGSVHPISLMRKEIIDALHRLGFTCYDGPELEFDFYNFSALNFPDDHPARDMQDTFFVDTNKYKENMVLRTHTSNIQIHSMLHKQSPIRMFAPGRTFRCDSDVTHTPMFNQVEGLIIDKNITFADMKGTMEWFLRALFGQDIDIRLRPSFFPFVEPGAEIDMRCVKCKGSGCNICKGTGWLEVAGCGMVHPNVLEAVNYDSEVCGGFAFGFGIDRMAMLKYGIPDSRQNYEGNFEFLNQFPSFT